MPKRSSLDQKAVASEAMGGFPGQHLVVVEREQGERRLNNACCTSNVQVIHNFSKMCFNEVKRSEAVI